MMAERIPEGEEILGYRSGDLPVWRGYLAD